MTLYTSAIFQYHRRQTREVKVGDVGIGGENPIRVQSMTISDTKDTAAVVEETRGLVEAGCEIVRITAPTIHHAENLKEIKKQLTQQGIHVPLVADIHFTPQAAMIAADYVEKVRINPGNYADRKLFAVKEYTDAEYAAEVEHMAEKFLPLVRKCKTNGVAMRIGTNHGSLSDRIMNRYGDTPEGMVESALEFVRLCESESFYDIILSMKASSPFIMIAAYRLLAQRMNELDMDYPFHLGVTEAGEGEDGRIKSAIGIGALLEDGIGDTIRVSLTEDSIHEIPVAMALVKKFNEWPSSPNLKRDISDLPWNPIARERRNTLEVSGGLGLVVGGQKRYGVFSCWNDSNKAEALLSFLQGTQETEERGDLVYLKSAENLDTAIQLQKKIQAPYPELGVGLVTDSVTVAQQALASFNAVVLRVGPGLPSAELIALAQQASQQGKLLDLRFPSSDVVFEKLEALRQAPSVLLSLEGGDPLHDYRRLAVTLSQEKLRLPIHLFLDAQKLALTPAPLPGGEGLRKEESALEVSSILGGLLVDGIGDSIEIVGMPIQESIRLSFNILQASRLRISKAEFIACPSCGRTLFDLQETTQRIKQKTAHLKGVKIAIMGCIVNGPGEMADADFGYVGGGPGKIHLYVGKECVEKNIPSEIADEKLIELIKAHGQWVDPPALKTAI